VLSAGREHLEAGILTIRGPPDRGQRGETAGALAEGIAATSLPINNDMAGIGSVTSWRVVQKTNKLAEIAYRLPCEKLKDEHRSDDNQKKIAFQPFPIVVTFDRGRRPGQRLGDREAGERPDKRAAALSAVNDFAAR
jgi:hypothetical protein